MVGPTPRASATRVIAAATAATTRSLAHLVPFLLQGLLKLRLGCGKMQSVVERLPDPVGSLPSKEAMALAQVADLGVAEAHGRAALGTRLGLTLNCYLVNSDRINEAIIGLWRGQPITY